MTTEALGRKSAPSPVIAAELAAFAEYKRELAAIFPPGTKHSPETAKAYRAVWRKFYPQHCQTAAELYPDEIPSH